MPENSLYDSIGMPNRSVGSNAGSTSERESTAKPLLYVVRRCDCFYRYWHDVTKPVPLNQAHAIHDQLTCGGTCSTTPNDTEYYDIFPIDPLPEWAGPTPLIIRRLHSNDATAFAAHLFGLSPQDRRLRFFQDVTDTQIQAYVYGMDFSNALILGAIRSGRMIGVAEALFNRSATERHVEIAVSVDVDSRGHGLGRYLVGQVINRAGLLGAHKAYLMFLRENRPIQCIVRALGGLPDMENLLAVVRPNAFAAREAQADECLAA